MASKTGLSLLHIAKDEKFINGAHWQFEKAFPGSNDFLIYTNNKNRKYKYVKPADNIKAIVADGKLMSTIAQMAPKYDYILLHGLSQINCSLFLAAENKDKYVGILWGAEFYHRKGYNPYPLYGPDTMRLDGKFDKKSLGETIKNYIKRLVLPHEKKDEKTIIAAAQQFRYIVTSLEEEFEMVKKSGFLRKDCVPVYFTYYPLEFIINGNDNKVNNTNILIGNSASLNNNHIEAMDALAKVNLGDRKVIVPLSYGNADYAAYIHEEGNRRFKDNFIGLKDFLPLAEYNKIMQSCGIVIMNHYRQQAFGNILACLWMGGKVYLSEKNVLLEYFRRLGVIIFSFENDFRPENEMVLTNLDEESILNNRTILKKEIGQDKLISHLKEQFENLSTLTTGI